MNRRDRFKAGMLLTLVTLLTPAGQVIHPMDATYLLDTLTSEPHPMDWAKPRTHGGGMPVDICLPARPSTGLPACP